MSEYAANWGPYFSVYMALPEHIKRRIFCDVTGCWNGSGHESSNGYPRFYYRGNRVMAHKLLFTLAKGITPRTRQIDHLCENIQCCNPSHLQIVSGKENCIRKYRRRKQPEGWTQVKNLV